ncbi:DNA-binding transcriptional regulator [Escherichia coli]|uniref:DNA-binding transcriptional regulator n=1 Tax=Escherichia coli TaxID=562 RepID=A0A376VWZ3_ECOLX|nr:DNA-binding transcriptional regulator [Escherichia coli]
MAATIPCSEAWLRRLFLRYTGKTPKEYYLDARLDLALSLLKQQGNSVGEVADTLNFFDSFHFSKAFKHKFGYAPSAVLKNTDSNNQNGECVNDSMMFRNTRRSTIYGDSTGKRVNRYSRRAPPVIGV